MVYTRLFKIPHKAGLFLAIFVVLAIAVGAWWYAYKNPKENPDKKNIVMGALKLREDQLEKLNQDSDADGLKDWEETIFGTDNNNPDTDGDGTKDGDEVIQSRDPLVKGPNDKIAPKEAVSKTAQTNITSDFTKKFLQGPIAQIISGAKPSLDPQSVEAYAERLLNRSILSSAPTIKATEVKVGSDNSAEAIEGYFKSFSEIFLNLQARGENEMDITVRAFKEQEYEELAKLDEYARAYDKAITRLKALSTPLSLKTFHTDILNYLLKFKLSVELMRNAESDPIQAMLVINERVKLSEQFETYLK